MQTMYPYKHVQPAASYNRLTSGPAKARGGTCCRPCLFRDFGVSGKAQYLTSHVKPQKQHCAGVTQTARLKG